MNDMNKGDDEVCLIFDEIQVSRLILGNVVVNDLQSISIIRVVTSVKLPKEVDIFFNCVFSCQ